ncbi:hypothetical protein DWY34_09070 [Blautia sp. AF25-12LB]|nr:hypothetical protein DWY34_09070 [Blautia sp. AF25-12LB]
MNVSCRFFVTRIRALSRFCADVNFDSMLHSVAVARYATLIWIKSPTNWVSQLTKSLFQTRFSALLA